MSRSRGHAGQLVLPWAAQPRSPAGEHRTPLVIAGRAFDAAYQTPPALKEAITRRLRNEQSPRFEISVHPSNARSSSEGAIVTLAPFRPRATPPRTVRLTLREPDAPRSAVQKIVFDSRAAVIRQSGRVWDEADGAEKEAVVTLVRQRLQGPVQSQTVSLAGRAFQASIDKEEVRFPFRPVKGHPLGIDEAGRDVLARIVYGFRISMSFGVLLVISSMILGIVIGAVQGYFGGWVDITGQRLIEIWSALPFLYIMILLGSVYGRSFTLLLVVYGVFNWIGISYYMRGEFLKLRKLEFVQAAVCLGAPTWKILFRHILPNALIPVITFFPFSLVSAIGSLAALDYLGFGMPPPTASWGELLNQAQQYRWAWWLILYPSLSLFLVMLLGVFVGEGVRNAFDPRDYSGVK